MPDSLGDTIQVDGKTYTKAPGSSAGSNLYVGPDGKYYTLVGTTMQPVIDSTNTGPGLGDIIGGSAGAAAGDALKYPGPTLPQMLLAFGVLAGVSLLLPKRYGIWLPLLVLLAYTARNPGSPAKFIDYLGGFLPVA